ncbi:hypothetical protein KSF78_0004655 [Schistosoma japonicum]|nr:hypothetical protein KSF78_0004655 [Schistosoma japonicum]KAH8875491.1 hypothetical protein KSF78_0004655 [Schistosoma japonicum]
MSYGLLVSNFMEAHEFSYENSSYSALIENIWDTTFFGQSSRNPSFFLIVGVLVLFSTWFTTVLTIYFVRIYFKPGKRILSHEDLSKNREILQLLEKNLSYQIEIYESETLDNGIASNENDDYHDRSRNPCFELNWNKVNECTAQSKVFLAFSNTHFSAFVNLLRGCYITESKYLLKEVKKTSQRLTDVDDICIECQMKTYLPRFSCCRKKFLDEELCVMINAVNERVYNLKYKIITHYRRWDCILAAIQNSSSSTALLNTTFETMKSNNEEIQSFLEETYVNNTACHNNLTKSVTDVVENKIKSHPSGKDESVIGPHYDNNSQSFPELSCSSNDFTNSFNNTLQNSNPRKQNSNRHSTKIPTFIHLSSLPPTPSRKCAFGSAIKKQHPLQSVDGKLLSPCHRRTSPSKRILSVAQSNDVSFSFTGLAEKSRIPLVDFTNTITGIQKPKPVIF